MDEQTYPKFYVKLDPFFPVFPKPYSYYQDAAFEEKFALQDSASRESFTERKLNTVTVRSKRGGLRRLDHSKPALVVDAYEAFNLAADYGLNCGMHDWRTFSRQVATAFSGDMGMDRHFYLQEQYDGKILDFMPEQKRESKVGMSMSNAQMEKYRRLRHLDKLYIYTDCVPREQGSWKYSQTNQPEVVTDYQLLPNDGVRPTWSTDGMLQKDTRLYGILLSRLQQEADARCQRLPTHALLDTQSEIQRQGRSRHPTI